MSRDGLKIALVLSLVFNAAVIGSFVYAFLTAGRGPERFGPPLGAGPRDPFGGRTMRFAREIGVPRDRAMRFLHVVADSSEGMRDLRDELQRKRGELAALLAAPEPDEEMIMAKVDEVSSVQGRLEKRLIRRVLGASSTLRPEERERLMRMIRMRCGGCDSVVPGCPAGAGEESEVVR